MSTIQEDLIADLTVELSLADENFSTALLTSKVNNAVREVKAERNYPEYYTDAQIENDIARYYSIIREIVLYDYSHVGAYGEVQRNEDGIGRTYAERKDLFNGVVPLSRI